LSLSTKRGDQAKASMARRPAIPAMGVAGRLSRIHYSAADQLVTRQKIGNQKKRRPTSKEDAGQTNGGLGWLLLLFDRNLPTKHALQTLCHTNLHLIQPDIFACYASVE